MMPDPRVRRESDHAWHVALNASMIPFEGPPRLLSAGAVDSVLSDGRGFMYEAKRLASEVPRLALLFARERTRRLPTVHHQCSHDHAGTPVKDNHLTCALGERCDACPFLAVLDTLPERFVGYERDESGAITHKVTEPVPAEEIDVMKAWTCATHIVMRGGDHSNEGYIQTVDDQMFWSNVFASLAGGDPSARGVISDEGGQSDTAP